MLHHDNAPCHTALSVTEFFTSKGILLVPQSPTHLTTVPVTFSFFPKLKNVLKRQHFGILENIQKSVMHMLKTIPVKDFQRCFQKWEQRLDRCVAAQ